MKTRHPRARGLCAILLLGFVAQTAFGATHASHPGHPGAAREQPADDEERGGHEPASCSFCRTASAVGHGLAAAPFALTLDAEAIRHPSAATPTPASLAPWARPASRAPPLSPDA